MKRRFPKSVPVNLILIVTYNGLGSAKLNEPDRPAVYALQVRPSIFIFIVRKMFSDRFMSKESEALGWGEYKSMIQTESNFE